MPSAILYDNLSDDGSVTASSWIAAAPPETLQDAHVSRRWQGTNGGSEFVLVTWPTAQTIDTFALLGLAGIFAETERSLSSAATIRLRVSSSDLTGIAGDLLDTGTIAGLVREDYGAFIFVNTSPLSARAVRIDISEAGAETLMAGRLVVGLRNQFALNFNVGWSYGYSDLSRKRKSAGGLSFIDRLDRYRVLDLTFQSLRPTDRYGFVMQADRLNGLSRDVLFLFDVNSSQLDRDSVWGLVQDLSPPTQPNFAYFSKTYRIEERL